jgi:ATP-dependent helicase/nuclease subunit A
MRGETIIIQGVIDCFFEEGDGLVLIDFKSGGVLSARDPETVRARALENYGEQMRLYRSALEAITGKPVREAVLYLTALGAAVSVAPQQVTI